MSFTDTVESRFRFLERDFSFHRREKPTTAGIGDVVEYERFPVEIVIGWYKGEVEVTFSIAYAYATDHPPFRPYISRTFDLSELAIRRNSSAFAEHISSLTNDAYVTSLEQADAVLGVYSAVMKDTCAPILGGDLSLLEEITIERRAKAPN
jgi:hypothetical protein